MGNDNEFYEKDGKNYHRPTRILDFFTPPELAEWKIKQAVEENLEKRKKNPDANITSSNQISKLALKHGSRVDELIRSNEDPTKKDSSAILSCITAYRKWKNDYNVDHADLVFPETFFHNGLWVAGTGDFYWKASKTFIDAKSSKSIREAYFFQLGFYSLDDKYDIDSLAVLRLDKEIADYEYLTNDKIGMTVTECQDGFKAALEYYKYYQLFKKAISPREPIKESE